MTSKNGMPPTHPGEILREDYLVPLGIPNERQRAVQSAARSGRCELQQ